MAGSAPADALYTRKSTSGLHEMLAATVQEWSEPCQDLEAPKWPWTWPVAWRQLGLKTTGNIYGSLRQVQEIGQEAEDVHTC